MGLLGSILLVFIVIHMGHFWREFHFEPMKAKRYQTVEFFGNNLPNMGMNDTLIVSEVSNFKQPINTTTIQPFDNGLFAKITIEEYKDLYGEVESAFKHPLYVAFYVIAMIALSYHLAHGFQSAFQTMGIRKKNYEKIIKSIGTIFFAIIIPALFAAMPLYFLFIKH